VKASALFSILKSVFKNEQPMESYMFCPECGGQVRVFLEKAPEPEMIGTILQALGKSLDKTEHFHGYADASAGSALLPH
jgi:hypothetical protein